VAVSLFGIFWRIAILALFAVGSGISVVIPQLHREFVEQLHWLDDRSFAEMLAVSQAAPGPNFLFVPLLGWRIAGWLGGVVALLAFLLFPVTISFTVGRLLHRHENAAIALVRRSFRAVTAGLWIASGTVIAFTVDRNLASTVITCSVVALALAFDISPLWWCLGAAVAGAVLL
jgi:chromate transporter